MNIVFPYGRKKINFDIPEKNIRQILVPKKIVAPNNLSTAFEEALQYPYDNLSVNQLIADKKPDTISIIVADKTRSNPEYPQLLKLLIDRITELHKCRINLIIAYGTHNRHTDAENEKLYGTENLKKVDLIHHDCDDTKNLTDIGTMSTGNKLLINRFAAESDMLIGIDTISPHAFAGFTGGRKIILPGISGRNTIEKNHAKISGKCGIGILDDNPVHIEMLEAMKKAGLNFLINFVRNTDNKIIKIFAGYPESAFRYGTEFAKEAYGVYVPDKADVVWVSCGGHPLDKTLYHTQRAMTAGCQFVKKNGTLILIAECPDGAGNKEYEKMQTENTPAQIMEMKLQEIRIGMHSALQTAAHLNHCEIILVSKISREKTEAMHFKAIPRDEINQYVNNKHGEQYSCYIIPDGSGILPVA
jgi:lactate racemase